MSNDDSLNFENMDSPVSASQFLTLHKDVKDIKSAIEGRPNYGEPGLVGKQKENRHRINSLDKEIEQFKNEFNQFKTRITAYATLGAGLGAAIIQVITSFLI